MYVYGLAAYGTWFADNGLFADVIARIATSKTVMTVDGYKKGSLENTVLSLSSELSRRFNFPNGFFAELQVELTYTYVDADTLTLSNGKQYRFESTDSLIGRIGGAIGANGSTYTTAGRDTWVEFGLGTNVNITPNTYVWADVEPEGGTIDEDWRATVGVRCSF